jgi:CHAT domain-containing protein
MRLLPRFVWVAGAACLLFGGPRPSAQQGLAPDRQVEAELAAGELHTYALALNARDFVRLQVEPLAGEAILRLIGSNGERVRTVDTRLMQVRPIRVSAIAAEAGAFRLEIEADRAAALRYRLRVTAWRPTTAPDAPVAEADAALADAEQLRLQGSASSIEQAAARFEDARRLYRDAGDTLSQAQAAYMLGLIRRRIGEPLAALPLYDEALSLFRTAGARMEEASALNSLGVAHGQLGDNLAAANAWRGAYGILRGTGSLDEAQALSNMGSAQALVGETQAALTTLRDALALARRGGHWLVELPALLQLGRVYATLGDHGESLRLYEQALGLARARLDTGGRAYESSALNNIGSAQAYAGNARGALPVFDEAIRLARTAGNRESEAAAANNRGWAHTFLGDHASARADFERALGLFQAIGNKRNEAYALANLGRTLAALGDRDSAFKRLHRALALRREVADRSGEALTLYYLAAFERDRGRLDEAHGHIDAAVALVETLRGRVAGPDLRSSYLAGVQDYYALAVDIRMRLDAAQPGRGWVARALEMAERSRARSLIEMLGEARIDIREGVEASLTAREKEVRQALNAAADRHGRVLAGLAGRATAADRARIEQEVATLTAEYREVQAAIRASSPRYAALAEPEPLTVAEIQRDVLDDETVLLEYALGAERGYVWAVSPTSVTGATLSGREDLEALARAFHAAIDGNARPEEARRAAARLGELLLDPVAGAIDAKRVLIVADGALQYLPFGALPIRGRTASSRPAPLVDAHEVVNLPSASTLALLRRERRERALRATVAVLADPVFRADDPRVGPRDLGGGGPAAAPRAAAAGSDRDQTPVTTFSRLIGSRREAQAVLALVPNGARKLALDFEASRQAATSPALAQYSILHFATHGVLDTARPELTSIVLSLVDERGRPQDGFLRLYDIYNLRLGADLVVLSACQTALGKEIKGEGLIGLTRGFMYAGAPRVVASLWKVDDRATAELMRAFYRRMLGPERLPPAAALGAAQNALRAMPRWQAPYYWAGFTLHGEWR